MFRAASGGAAGRPTSRSARVGRPAHDPVGHPLAHPTPVIRSTASARDSMCWTFTVVMTAMPESRISSTSSHRFACRPEFGTFVWASSSMRATSGRRAMTASTSISSHAASRTGPACAGRRAGRGSAPWCRGACASRRTRPRRRRRAGTGAIPRRAWRTVLPTPAAAPRYTRKRRWAGPLLLRRLCSSHLSPSPTTASVHSEDAPMDRKP